jgi:hypothetical protein
LYRQDRFTRAALSTCGDAKNQIPISKTFFDDLRALTRYLLFPTWDALMDFMMKGLEIGPYAKPP